MGWFDFLRRGRGANPPPATPPLFGRVEPRGESGAAKVDAGATKVDAGPPQVGRPRRGGEPRSEHYYFAHKKLRSFAFAEPEQCFGILHSDQARDFLSEVWHAVKEGAVFTPSDPALRFDDLKLHRRPIGIYPAVVLEMPEAKFPLEAHFVALVWQIVAAEGVMIRKRPELLYYTLERAAGGPSEAVLCEWREDAHVHLGAGPRPDLDEFVAHLDPLVMKRADGSAL